MLERIFCNSVNRLPNASSKYLSLGLMLLVVLGIILTSGCASQKEKVLNFRLGPEGVQTEEVEGDWVLKRLQLGVTNVGTKSIPSFDMKFELLKDDQVIDEKRVGPWQGLPPDSMRAFSIESLDDNESYILRMSDPQPGSYVIRIHAYDSQTKEKVGEADIPFEIKTQ